jgi:hypothetical protein
MSRVSAIRVSEKSERGAGGSYPCLERINDIRVTREYRLERNRLAATGAEVGSFLMPSLMGVGEHF